VPGRGRDGVEVHFLEHAGPCSRPRARDDLEAVDKRLGFLAAVGFDHADDDIDAIGLFGMAGRQHLIGLADAGCCTEKDLQAAARFAAPPASSASGDGLPSISRTSSRIALVFPHQCRKAADAASDHTGHPGIWDLCQRAPACKAIRAQADSFSASTPRH
jgi:hypothetical protein